MLTAEIAELFYQLSNAPRMPPVSNDHAPMMPLGYRYADQYVAIHIAATHNWRARLEKMLDSLDSDLQSMPEERAQNEGRELWILSSETLQVVTDAETFVDDILQKIKESNSTSDEIKDAPGELRGRASDADTAARTTLEARAAIYFRILALAEKYAPRSRSEAIAASVERSLISYPVVNGILAL